MPPARLLVVADTTPLLFLPRPGWSARRPRSSLWPRHRARHGELVEGNPAAEGIDQVRAATWLDIDRGADESALSQELAVELDAGEAAAIALAEFRQADLPFIDDLDGRRIAPARGLAIRGTVGVIVAARQRGLLTSLTAVLDDLIKRGFRLAPGIYPGGLRAAGEATD